MTAATTALPTKGEFSQQIDQTFRAIGPGGAEFDLQLVEFHDVLDTEAQETFSMIFRGPAEMPPAQTIYRLSNEELGEHDIFLVGVRQDASGTYFEAVFNRLKR